MGIEHHDSDALLSALGWWQLAGVDVAVSEAPRDWLQRDPPALAPREISAPSPSALVIPDDLAALQSWLANRETFPELGMARVAPVGRQGADVMLIGDMPDPADLAARLPFQESAGQLLDAMLRAIGKERAAAYLALLASGRPATGILNAAALDLLTPATRRHIGLVAPKAVLLLGDTTSRALLGMSLIEARGREHLLNHDHGTTPAIATFHPRFLLSQPARKADAWADLCLLLEILEK